MSVYACSDLHGSINLYNQITNFLKPEDVVYFLGDAGDRGSAPWETIKAILKNPQFIYLKGNHEDMLVRAAREYIIDGFLSYDYSLLCQNGGYKTFENWQEEEFANAWIAHLDKLPLRAEYVNKDGIKFIMTHAGLTPGKRTTFEKEDLLWSREHFFEKWPEGEEKTIVLHGHTPIPNLYKRLNEAHRFYHNEDLEYDNEPGIYTYCGGHKICLDCGTFVTGHIVLFDLDTYDEHIFEEN